MLFIWTIIYYPLALLSFIIGAILTIILAGFKIRPADFRRSQRPWGKFLLKLAGVKLIVRGLENIPPDEPIIFVSNHQSAADIAILWAAVPRSLRFTPKRELFQIPLFGPMMSFTGHIAIDREAGRKAIKSLERSKDLLTGEESIIFFPEGTRSKTGALKPFHKGFMRLIFSTNTRVVPIAINGSINIMGKGGFVIHPAQVKVSFGKPLSFSEFGRTKADYEQAVSQLRDSIQNML